MSPPVYERSWQLKLRVESSSSRLIDTASLASVFRRIAQRSGTQPAMNPFPKNP